VEDYVDEVTSARLLAAIHRGEEAAIKELFLLYAPLLREQARRMGIDAGERGEIVTTVLDDVVVHLIENALTPRHLARYLIAALRNGIRSHNRELGRRRSTYEYAYERVGRELIVAECHSEYALRASAPNDAGNSIALRSAIAKLASKSASELTADEMTMMVRVGHHVPLRDVADQLGIGYGAARVRLHRLRDRFRKLAAGYVATLKPEEKREIERFFRRADLHLLEPQIEELEERAIPRDRVSQSETNNAQA
jgi:DNA-directed RNA polymerase specialized sigma24 family protein